MTQRALVLSALGDHTTHIDNALVCDDSHFLTEALVALGTQVSWQDQRVTVTPASSLAPPEEAIFCGNAGTTVRFTSCMSLLCSTPLSLDGDDYMRQRPIGPLTDALAQLGVTSTFHGQRGCLPVTLTPSAATAAEANIDSSISSQYLSGLLMVAPRLKAGLRLRIVGREVSRPYVDMTVAMMRRCGAAVQRTDDGYVVQSGGYPNIADPFPVAVEADWSGAAFLLAGQRISGHRGRIPGCELPQHSLQGDAVIVAWLRRLNEPADNHFDLIDHPDLIAPLTAAALFASAPTTLTHVAHARIKECDRVAVLAKQLQRCGADIEFGADHMRIQPLNNLALKAAEPITLDPSHDHRMAMTFGLVSLRLPWIAVANPECVSKSFGDFWTQLATLRAAVHAG